MASVDLQSLTVAHSGTNPSSPVTLSVVCNGTNRLLIVAIAHENTSSNITGVTFDGVAMTQIRETTNGTQVHEFWGLVAPNVTTANVSVAFSGGSMTQMHIAAYVLANAKQSLPTVYGENTGSAVSNVTVSITPTALNTLIIVGAVGAEGTTYTVDGILTQLINSSSSFELALGGIKRVTSIGAISLGWTSSNSTWSVNAISVEPYGDRGPIRTNSLRPRIFAPGIAK